MKQNEHDILKECSCASKFAACVQSLNQVNNPSLLLLLASRAHPSNACKGIIVSQGWRDSRVHLHGPRHTRPGRTQRCNRQLGSGYAYACVSPGPVFQKHPHTRAQAAAAAALCRPARGCCSFCPAAASNPRNASACCYTERIV